MELLSEFLVGLGVEYGHFKVYSEQDPYNDNYRFKNGGKEFNVTYEMRMWMDLDAIHTGLYEYLKLSPESLLFAKYISQFASVQKLGDAPQENKWYKMIDRVKGLSKTTK